MKMLETFANIVLPTLVWNCWGRFTEKDWRCLPITAQNNVTTELYFFSFEYTLIWQINSISYKILSVFHYFLQNHCLWTFTCRTSILFIEAWQWWNCIVRHLVWIFLQHSGRRWPQNVFCCTGQSLGNLGSQRERNCECARRYCCWDKYPCNKCSKRWHGRATTNRWCF